MTAVDVRAQEGVLWQAQSHARFWEPGAEDFARRKLHLPGGVPVTGAAYDRLRIAPYQLLDGPTPGNQVTSVGLALLWNQLVNGVKAWNVGGASTAITGIGVGDSTTADSKADTDLLGSSKAYRGCDTGYPRRFGSLHPITGLDLTEGQALFSGSFAAGEANLTWNEYVILVPTASATAFSNTASTGTKPSNYTALNRKSPAGLGVKTNGTPAQIFILLTIA